MALHPIAVVDQVIDEYRSYLFLWKPDLDSFVESWGGANVWNATRWWLW